MKKTTVHMAWDCEEVGRRFRTGVSLHSHTLHSREVLQSIIRLAHTLPVVAPLVRRQERRYRAIHHHSFDASRVWWTPPMTPRAAYALEAGFISEHLGLTPLVSLTDHDNIEAPLALRVLNDTREAPISVEWTVPWNETFFHFGVHNLPSGGAQSMMQQLSAFTASPRRRRLLELLDWLAEDPAVLIVLNHPCWDEKGIGKQAHRDEFVALLQAARSWIHALEANGLRPWAENREVAQRCRATGLPLISGGDRHGREPNAILNLTNAGSFAEFVGEVRGDGWSDVYFAAHAAESRTLRVYRTLCDILRDDPAHGLGWVRWSDRVFYQFASGEVTALSAAWKTGPPHVVRWFVDLVKLCDHDRLAPAIRALGGLRREMAL